MKIVKKLNVLEINSLDDVNYIILNIKGYSLDIVLIKSDLKERFESDELGDFRRTIRCQMYVNAKLLYV